MIDMEKPKIRIKPVSQLKNLTQYFSLKATCIDSYNLLNNNKGFSLVNVGCFMRNDMLGFNDLIKQHSKY